MRVLAILLFAIPLVSRAEPKITNELCESWAKRLQAKPWYDLSTLTKENALAGLHTMSSFVEEESDNYRFRYFEYAEAEFHVRGYMMKRELLDAWKNREHDADEIGALCTLWTEYADVPLTRP